MKKNIANLLFLQSLFLSTVVCFVGPVLGQEVAEQTDAKDGDLDILVVANLKAPLETIGMQELKAVFLKKKLYTDKGQEIVPINAQQGTALRTQFQMRALGMEPEEEMKYWEKQKILHAILPPAEFVQTQKAVLRVRHSIGYIFRKDFRPNVSKILLVILHTSSN
jgi:hypothetical protein